MTLFGLTGGVGMGKSTSARILGERGIPVIDTDHVARQLVEPGQPALREIVEHFGAEVLGPDGRLRRELLARRVFADAEARRALESILHPRIREVWMARAEQWRAEGRELAVVEIPLLYETSAASHFNAVICTACTAETQRKRLMARNWSAQECAQRVGAQMPAEKKVALADFVVWTEAGLDIHAAQLERIIASRKPPR